MNDKAGAHSVRPGREKRAQCRNKGTKKEGKVTRTLGVEDQCVS